MCSYTLAIGSFFVLRGIHGIQISLPDTAPLLYLNARFRFLLLTAMARDNTNEKYPAQLLGHASPTTTKRICTHVMGDKVVQINDMLDAHAEKVLKIYLLNTC